MIGTSEAARRLGCDRDTVSRMCRNGVFPSAEQDGKGKPWRISEEDIENYIINNGYIGKSKNKR